MVNSSYASMRALLIISCIMGVGCIPFIQVKAQESTSEHENICKNCLDKHYSIARDSIVRAWTVLDTLRSMTIDPKDRAPFAQRIFNDVIAVMHALSALATSCHFCSVYYRQHGEDITYLEEILGYMMEAFETVFTPYAHGEEKLLHSMMETIIESMQTIRREVGPDSLKI